MTKKTYITTAIPYVNGAPHAGHVEDYLIADFYVRYQKIKGNDVRFQAGTDEHGSKIQKKAAALGIDVKDYVDQNSKKFQDFIAGLDVHPTDFVRTTDDDHVRRVQMVWEKLKDHIYLNEYEGWYCEGCEAFVTQKEYDENGGVCPDHKMPYARLSEKNYYYRISDFKDQIRKAIESDQIRILPDFRKKEVLKLLADTPDASISRPVEQLSWGVPVPGDDSQVMYVWLDALSNYITVLGYPEHDISDAWPADIQIVGKDILRFHAILWPAMLLGLGLPLPKVILSHGFILSNGQKMSKSIGNVIDPIEALNRHGLDALRYYYARHIDTFTDSDFTWDKYEEAYANELANDYGNLVQRLAALCKKNEVAGKAYAPAADPDYDALMDQFRFTDAMEYAWGRIQNVNKSIEDTKPWSVAKEDPAEAKKILGSLVQDLLDANQLLKPFLPVADRVEEIFTSEKILPPETPLFPKN